MRRSSALQIALKRLCSLRYQKHVFVRARESRSTAVYTRHTGLYTGLGSVFFPEGYAGRVLETRTVRVFMSILIVLFYRPPSGGA